MPNTGVYSFRQELGPVLLRGEFREAHQNFDSQLLSALQNNDHGKNVDRKGQCYQNKIRPKLSREQRLADKKETSRDNCNQNKVNR